MVAHRKLLYGVGVNDWMAPTKVMGVPIWNYRLWQNMLERCHSERFKLRRPTYIDVGHQESWSSLSMFTEDIMGIDNWDKVESDGWAMDKDILIQGNRMYTKDTVCFVPIEINNLFVNCGVKDNGLPIGVSYVKDRGNYLASIKMYGRTVNLGRYRNISDASEAYMEAKKSYVIELVNSYRGILAENVLDSLLRFRIT